MHGLHHLERRQAAVGDLLVLEGPRDHTVHLATFRQGCVGEYAHQPDVSAPVDEPDSTPGQQLSQRRCRPRKLNIDAGARSAVDADRRRDGRHLHLQWRLF